MVLRHLMSMDASSDLKSDLQELQDDLSNKFSSVNSNRGSNTMFPNRKSSVGYQEEKLISKSILYYTDLERNSNSLKLFYEEILRNITGDINGAALIAILMTSKILPDEDQAISILNNMLSAGYLSPVDMQNYPTSSVVNSAEAPVLFNPRNMYRATKITDTIRRRDIRFASNASTNQFYLTDSKSPIKSVESTNVTSDLPSIEPKILNQLQDIYLMHEKKLIGDY